MKLNKFYWKTFCAEYMNFLSDVIAGRFELYLVEVSKVIYAPRHVD
jgi:hypothetical protein